jgi:transposase-like protein
LRRTAARCRDGKIKAGKTIDFLLTAKRDKAAARRFSPTSAQQFYSFLS